MTRRSFLTNLAGALAVLVLPAAVKAAAEERIEPIAPQKLYGFQERWTLDPNPPRFNWTGTEYVRVHPENAIGAPSSAYLDAAYDGIFLRGVPRIFG